MIRNQRTLDELLVLRSQEGDAAAFDALVGRWQERLWRHAFRLTGKDDLAWDALQEAWIAITRGLSGLEDVVAFPAWAFQIVSYKCRDRIRRDRRRRAVMENYAETVQHLQERPQACDPRSTSLRQTIESLDGPDRAILALRYDEGFDVAEIAGILNVAEGTVKSRLFHARQRLRELLEQSHDP